MLVETIICYCVCDDLLKALGYMDDPQCKIAQRKRNSKRPHSGPVSYQQRTYRKRIETVISQITRRFSRSIVARSAGGFTLRLELFLLAYSLSRTLAVLT